MSVPKFLPVRSCIMCEYFDWRNQNPFDPYCNKHDYEFELDEYSDRICEDFKIDNNELL